MWSLERSEKHTVDSSANSKTTGRETFQEMLQLPKKKLRE